MSRVLQFLSGKTLVYIDVKLFNLNKYTRYPPKIPLIMIKFQMKKSGICTVGWQKMSVNLAHKAGKIGEFRGKIQTIHLTGIEKHVKLAK